MAIFGCGGRVTEVTERVRQCPALILATVFICLLLDNILFTIVVPIFPDYVYSLDYSSPYFPTHNLTLPANTTWPYDTPDNGSYDTPPLGEIENENSRIGWLLSSKAIVQLCVNPFLGSFTVAFGYNLTMFLGFCSLLSSTLLYAFGDTYALLVLARSIHGVATACITVAGMGTLASVYSDDKERSKAMGIALGGMALGVLIGYPTGGIMYQFLGKTTPFLTLAVVILIVGVFQVWILQPCIPQGDKVTNTPIYRLLMDPYILVVCGAILFPEMSIAMLEPTLPIYLLEHLNPANWQLGLVFVPDSVGFFIGCIAFGVLAVKIGRWITGIIALVFMGVSVVFIPEVSNIWQLIAPHFGLGISLGMVDAAMMPLLAKLVEKRHVAVYGSVYALAQFTVSLAFAIGPSLGGQLVKLIGFPWLIRGMALANILFAPFCLFLRRLQDDDETKPLATTELEQL